MAERWWRGVSVMWFSGLLWASSSAWAAGSEAADGGLFEKGTWALTLSGGYAMPITNDEERYTSVAFAPTYYFGNGVGIVPQIRGLYVDTEFSDTLGGDFSLSLRWHFVRHESWTAFIQGGAGVAYFDHRIPPPEATRFNWLLTVGGGVTYQLTESCHLVLGVDVLHYSNGGIQGPDRHRGSNALSGVVGLMWVF